MAVLQLLHLWQDLATWQIGAIIFNTKGTRCLIDSRMHNKHTRNERQKENDKWNKPNCPKGHSSNKEYVSWQIRKVERSIETYSLIVVG